MLPTLSTAVELLLKQLAQSEPEQGCHPGQQAIHQIAVACQPAGFSLPEWLAAQRAPCRLFWKSRDQQQQYAALGILKQHRVDPAADLSQQISDCQRWLAGATGSPSIYGGIAFCPRQSKWQHFEAGRFVLPLIELCEEDEQQWSLRCNLITGGDPLHSQQMRQQCLSALSQLITVLPPLPPQPMALTGADFSPTYRQWEQMVQQVMHEIKHHDLQKVVLSRRGVLRYPTPPQPWQLLQRWRSVVPSSFHFGFQFAAEDTFIGCSPERLLRRRGSTLCTEALAGTTIRCGDEQQDQLYAEALIEDPKNRLENSLVSQQIQRRLLPLCHDLTPSGELSVLKLRHLQHLIVGLQGTVRAGVADGQLLAALHPTPAVGGTPRDQALAFIHQHETYDRGWYAGAVGRLTADDTELCVAIRSAHVTRQTIELFSGAGIVTGSDAAMEWQELGNKLSTVFSLLMK